MNQNQFQTQQTHDVANEAVAEQVEQNKLILKMQLVSYVTTMFIS